MKLAANAPGLQLWIEIGSTAHNSGITHKIRRTLSISWELFDACNAAAAHRSDTYGRIKEENVLVHFRQEANQNASCAI